MQKITPCLWFDKNAEEAVNFYVSIFSKNPAQSKGISKIKDKTYYDKESSKASGMPEGTLLTVNFVLNGQEFLALNGGPVFKFTEAISLIVNCKNQKEVDYFWDKLTDGGAEIECGLLKDKYGLSWQITPIILSKLISDKDPKKSSKAMAAMLQMKKIDIATLKKAANF